jgi:hypothetical protein
MTVAQLRDSSTDKSSILLEGNIAVLFGVFLKFSGPFMKGGNVFVVFWSFCVPDETRVSKFASLNSSRGSKHQSS